MDKKIDYLEGIRGLAAFFVILNHFIISFYPAAHYMDEKLVNTTHGLEMFLAKTPLNMFYNGNSAVCIFFALSGFVLTFRFFKEKKIDSIVSNAYRRYFRLIVPVFIVSLLSYIFIQMGWYLNKEVGYITNSGKWLSTFWDFNENFKTFLKVTLYDVFFEGNSSYNMSLWTMVWEFKGSFLVFGLVALFGNTNKRYLVYILFIYLTRNNYYLAFILGMMLSDYVNLDHPIKEKIARPSINIIVLIIGVYLYSFPTHFHGSPFYDTLHSIFNFKARQYHIIGAIFILFSVINLKSLQSFFSLKPLLYLGRVSFSAYLIHPIILGSFSCILFLEIYKYMNHSMSVLVVTSLSLLLIFVASHLLTKYIDEPITRITRRVYNSFFINKGKSSNEKSEAT